MASFTLTAETAERVKIKFLRKYRDLANATLSFAPGQEDQLVQQLMQLVNRDQKYIEFTIQKALKDANGNRL
jgi:transcription termination factor NusB